MEAKRLYERMRGVLEKLNRLRGKSKDRPKSSSMETKKLYERMMRALEKLNRLHGERGPTTKIYTLWEEKWPKIEDTDIGTIEYRRLSKRAVTALQEEIGIIFPQVKDIQYFVPGKDHPLPHRGLIVELPSKNEYIGVEIWENGTFRIVSEDFIPGHHGILGRAHLHGVEAEDLESEKLLRKHFDGIRKEVIKKFNRGEPPLYYFEAIYGVVKKDESSPTTRQPGVLISVDYTNPKEPNENLDKILRNLSEIRKKLLEAHEKLKKRSRR